MNLYPQFPDCLRQGEFAVLRLALEAQNDGCLILDDLLGMRHKLKCAAGEVLGARAKELFEPLISPDPVAVRRFQKPSPGFVVKPDIGAVGSWLEGDRIAVDILFLGTAVQSIGDLVVALKRLGEIGVGVENQRYAIDAVSTLTLNGQWQRLPSASQKGEDIAPVLIRLDQWLEANWPRQVPLLLEILAPMRLLRHGKVLRRPRFEQFFPFMLRRVTSMLHAWCGLEPVDDPSLLLDAAREVESTWRHACWVDWRDAGDREQVGGVTGTMQLGGERLDGLLWVILLATLLGVGKGASFGAGKLQLGSFR